MKEAPVYFGKGRRVLEGLFVAAGGTKGAVIAHPHSLMGGNMWNPVVETVAGVLRVAGISTLRFNFRGVCGSSGSFDDGRGEGEDLLAACDFLEGRGVEEILPAGYSFGAWVAAGVLGRRAWAPALFVAPPIRLFPFDPEGLRNRVGIILCGDSDPYCPADEIRGLASDVGCPLVVIPGADHFFQGREQALAASIEKAIRSRLSRQPAS